MTDSPERIWAVPERNCTVYMSGNSPITAQDGPFTHRLHGRAHEYLRADLVAVLEAENRRLREALESCPPTSNPTVTADYHLERINAWWKNIARAALFGEDEPCPTKAPKTCCAIWCGPR